MKIIKSNDELMQFIPNVVTAVEGEKDLFTKIQTYIIMAESWLFRNVAKPSVFDNETAMVYAQSIVAAEAFRNAIPSLNVILTENGFGIVSNGSVAPASKDRIDKLAEALIEHRDNAIEQLVLSLGGAGTTFSRTVFAGYEAQRMQGISTHLFDRFMEQRPKVLKIQHDLAEDAVSYDILEEAVEWTYSNELERPEGYNTLFIRIKDIICKQLKGVDAKQEVKDLVEFIRTHTNEFPYWASSTVAEKWADHRYVNDKKSGGYWL